jgi:lysozyme
MSMPQPRMQLSSRGLDFIKGWEKFRSAPYLDEAGHLTGGYGHKQRRGESFPDIISIGQAITWLAEDVDVAESIVRAWVCPKLALTQREFDALVSFVFNVGAQPFGTSTLLAKLQAGDRAAAAEQILRWDHIHKNGQVIESEGLTRRRKAEHDLFLGVSA